MDSAAHPDSILPNSILIVDFGSQVTQLIARRVREAGVYCEIAPFSLAEAAFDCANMMANDILADMTLPPPHEPGCFLDGGD